MRQKGNKKKRKQQQKEREREEKRGIVRFALILLQGFLAKQQTKIHKKKKNTNKILQEN